MYQHQQTPEGVHARANAGRGVKKDKVPSIVCVVAKGILSSISPVLVPLFIV